MKGRNDKMPLFEQIQLMTHTLGGNDPDKWYRNHFVTGLNCDGYTDLVSLEKQEYMKRVPSPSFMPDDSITFCVTDKGKKELQRLLTRR